MSDKEYAEILKGLLVPIHAEPAMDRAIELLEQEPVLDKIIDEIEQIEINGHIRDVECFRAGINVALEIIDKYNAESEE